MPGAGDTRRFLAACDECGSVYAALERADGTIVPIGTPDGCSCGGTTFSRLETAVDGRDGAEETAGGE